MRPAPTKPCGWQGRKGDTYWTKSTRYGRRYKTCGYDSLGIGRGNHYGDCTSPEGRDEFRMECVYMFSRGAERMARLGRNLAVAGALQRAFGLGYRSRIAPPAWMPNVRGEAAP